MIMATAAALDVIRRYSPLKQDPVESPARVKSLVDRGIFALEKQRWTAPVRTDVLRSDIAAYVAWGQPS